MSIEYEGVSLNRHGFQVQSGSLVLWEDLYAVLEAIPEVASDRLGWFPFAGPPCDCIGAVDEVKKVVEALFPKGEESSEGKGLTI